jgi:P27 family predicted phage terminase small subunit
MRGRRPLPTHLKVLRGNPGKQSLNDDEPAPSAPDCLPEAPAFLSAYAREEWKRVMSELFLMGLYTNFDQAVLCAYCESWARWRTANELVQRMAARDVNWSALLVRAKNGTPLQNPVVLTAARAAADMCRYAQEFGFSPGARTRIANATASDASIVKRKFEGLIATN